MSRRSGMLAACCVMAALAGCSPSTQPTTPAETDEQQVQLSVAAVPEVADDGLFGSAEPASFAVGGHQQTPLTDIEGEPLPAPEPPAEGGRRYWRVVHDVDREFQVSLVSPDENGRPRGAVVQIHKTLNGSLHTVGGSPATHTVKSIQDVWTRTLWLSRETPTEPGGRAWRIVAASAAEVTSPTEAHPQVSSVRLQGNGLDVTMNDASSAIFWHDLARLASGVDVNVTVTTQAPDDVVVFMHSGARQFLTANGDNTYSGVWRTQALPGIRHFGVNAVTTEALTPEGEYRSHAWLFPYLNQGEVVAEGL